MKKDSMLEQSANELLEQLMQNVSAEKRQALLDKINTANTNTANTNQTPTETPIYDNADEINSDFENDADYVDNHDELESYDNHTEHQNLNDVSEHASNHSHQYHQTHSSTERPDFDTLLRQVHEKGDILSPAEKEFFFSQQKNAVQMEVIEKEPEIFEEVMLAPIFLSIKRLLYLNLAFLGVLIFVVSFSAYLQSVNQELQNSTLNRLGNIEKQSLEKTGQLWDFLALPAEQRRKELEAKINSQLSTKKEKKACYFLLATISYEEFNYSAAQEYVLKGVQLSDEK